MKYGRIKGKSFRAIPHATAPLSMLFFGVFTTEIKYLPEFLSKYGIHEGFMKFFTSEFGYVYYSLFIVVMLGLLGYIFLRKQILFQEGVMRP